MKKRILSMLLLVAMVVTALPLFALTAFATGTTAEEPTFTEEDYNDLYVKDGLFFAADFFKTKEGASLSGYIWKSSGNASLSAGKATAPANGKLTLDADVLTVKPAGSMAATDYNLTIEHVLDVQSLSSNQKTFFLRGGYLIAWNTNGLAAATEDKGATFAFSSYSSSATSPSSWSNGNSWAQFTYSGFTRNFVPNGTTFAFRKGASTVSYAMNFADNVDLSLDEVNALKAATAVGTRLPTFAIYNAGGTGFVMDVNDAPFYADTSCLIGYRLSRQKNGNSYEWLDENYEPYTGITTQILQGLTPENCTYKLYATKEEADAAMADAKAAAPDKTFMVDQVYSIPLDETPYGVLPAFFSGAGWTDSIGGTATFTGDVYAIRYYSRALSETETLVNHVADLAKFFGLNIAAYRLLDGEGRAAVGEAMATYQLTSDAAAVGEDFEAAVADAAAAQYEGVVDDTLLDLMLSYGLDPFLAVAMPRDVAVNTTALLASLVKDNTFDDSLGATVQEAYAKAIELDAAAYAERADEDLDFYNALYVQEKLVYALDFYQFNEFWGHAIPALPTPITDTYKAIPGAKYYIVKNGTVLEDVAFDSLAELENALKDTTKYPTKENDATVTYKFEIRYTQTDEELKALGNLRFTYADGKVTGFNSAFVNAATPWKTAVGNYLNAIAHKATRGLGYAHATMGSSNYGSTSTSQSGDGSHYDRPIFAVKNGYMEVYRFRGNSWIDTNTLTPAGLGTMQLVTATVTNVSTDYGFYFRDVDFASAAGGIADDMLVFSHIGNTYGTTRHYFSKTDRTLGIGDAFTLTWEQDRGNKSAADAEIENRLWINTGSLTPNGPAVIADSNSVAQNMLGWTTNTVNYYAIRYYDSEFDDAKIARNHFADVAKRFKLNLYGMDTENAEQMKALYAAVADISLTGSTRTEAQLAVLSVLGEGVSDYYAGYESVLGEKFDAIKAYHLDPEAYLLLPAGLLFKTNALLAELEAGTFAGASAAAAYTAAIASDCESYYALDVKGTDFYDELYAQDGYVFGLDFFTLGRPEIWGDAAPAVPFKDVDLSGVTIADGMTETTTTYSNNADLKKALDTFKADHLKFTEQFITERDNASLNFGHYIGSSTTYALAGAVYEPATGSIRFRKDVQGANGIQPYNFPEIVSDNVSFQLIMAPNEGLSNAFFFFYNIRPTIDESYNITGLSNGFTKTSHTKHAPIPRSGDAQMLTFTLENAVTNKADVTYSIRLWNELLSETKGSCTAIDNNTYIGWSQSTTMNLYAFRVYNAELTPEEIKQNHFADVAKYFRLNLMGMDVEDSDQMTALYDAVANISLTSSTRAEAQLAVLSVLAEEAKAELGAAYADLKAEYTAPEEAALVALAAKYLLPIDVLEDVLTSARDMSAAYDALTEDAILGEGSSEAAALFFREQADLAYYYYSYAHLDPENETWTDYLDVLAENRLDAEAMMALPHADRLAIVSLGLTEQEALDAEVDKVMEKYVAYAAEKANKYTVDDYNALYVRDGLFFAADFFGTNALWGADGADVADKGSLIDYAWLTEGKAAMEITSAATVADGKLVMDANHLKVAPAGSMTAADYNMTVEHVLDVKALSSNSKPFSFRDIYLNAWSNDGLAEATKEAGAAYAFSGFNSDFGPSTWNYINSHNQGAIAGFTRPILTLNSAITYTFRKGASTLSYVMNFADYLDLSQAEVEALRAEVLAEEREPVVSIHSAGADTVAYPVPDAPLYLDFENCVLGWRVYLPNGNERQWVDEDFNLYFVGKSTAEKKEILDAITSADEYKLYATEEEAKAAIAAHAEAHPEDENNGKYATDRFYAIALDETPYGVHPELLRGAGWTDTIGGTATFTGDVYAIRYYSRALTKAETLQNHFADLAKYFRLDIGNYLAMSDDEKLALHEAMAACQLTDSRESVLDAYYAGCAAQYANLAVTDDADVNAALAAFAAAVGLDASRLVTLSAGEAFVGKILALADPAYATSRDIVNYRLDKEILDFYGATAFAGISVRVDNGTLPTEAGVRALYSIDEATLREMIRKYGVDSKLSFGAKITVNGVAAATLTFTATLAEDGSLSYEGTNSAGGTAAVKKVNGKLAFSYTVTYGDGDLTEENLNAEYSFVRFVTIAGEDVVVDHGSAIFGATVSAAEAYGYFAEAYAEDAVVAKVTAALTPAE